MNNMTRQKFMTMFNEILTDRNGTTNTNLLLANQKGDEVDVVSLEKEQNLNIRLDQRNLLFLKKVEDAKQKIIDGTYGTCEECEEDISQKRLLARPTANMCINCQEEKERNEFGTFKKRRDLDQKSISEENVGEHISKRKKYNSINDIHFESVVDL